MTGLKVALEERPDVILTNLDADEKITWAGAKDGPAYYLVKSNVDMDEIVNKMTQSLSEKVAVPTA